MSDGVLAWRCLGKVSRSPLLLVKAHSSTGAPTSGRAPHTRSRARAGAHTHAHTHTHTHTPWRAAAACWGPHLPWAHPTPAWRRRRQQQQQAQAWTWPQCQLGCAGGWGVGGGWGGGSTSIGVRMRCWAWEQARSLLRQQRHTLRDCTRPHASTRARAPRADEQDLGTIPDADLRAPDSQAQHSVGATPRAPQPSQHPHKLAGASSCCRQRGAGSDGRAARHAPFRACLCHS
jgi:hypothetical protein